MRHTETESGASRLGCARECRLAVQAELDRHGRRRYAEQAAEHLTQAQPSDSEPLRDEHVLIALESLALRRVEHRERILHGSIIGLERGAADEHLTALQ